MHFPNNKPHITKEVNANITKKRLALKNKDHMGAAEAQRELNILLKKARESPVKCQ